MLWLAFYGVDRRKLTLAKALCAETVLDLMTDDRSKKAVVVVLNGAAAYDADAAAYDARMKALERMADIVRNVISVNDINFD
jgi:hypothetical protein